MEEAEHAFLRSLGLGVICKMDNQVLSWPRVKAECNYRSAIRFEELINIEVSSDRIGTKSLTYGFHFSRDQVPVADGTVTTVCCRFEQALDGHRPESVPIPSKIVDLL